LDADGIVNIWNYDVGWSVHGSKTINFGILGLIVIPECVRLVLCIENSDIRRPFQKRDIAPLFEFRDALWISWARGVHLVRDDDFAVVVHEPAVDAVSKFAHRTVLSYYQSGIRQFARIKVPSSAY
jgi:hypothetical protein